MTTPFHPMCRPEPRSGPRACPERVEGAARTGRSGRLWSPDRLAAVRSGTRAFGRVVECQEMSCSVMFRRDFASMASPFALRRRPILPLFAKADRSIYSVFLHAGAPFEAAPPARTDAYRPPEMQFCSFNVLVRDVKAFPATPSGLRHGIVPAAGAKPRRRPLTPRARRDSSAKRRATEKYPSSDSAGKLQESASVDGYLRPFAEDSGRERLEEPGMDMPSSSSFASSRFRRLVVRKKRELSA